MVIKDVLKKLNTTDPNDPKVAALREKLAKIKEQQGGKADTPSPQPAPKQEAPAAQAPPEEKQPEEPAPTSSGDAEIDALAQASEEEQRRFAQQKDPQLIVQDERTHKLVAKQVGEIIELATAMQKRIDDLEKEKSTTTQHIERIENHNKELNEKMQVIDGRLEKFMSLYEIITNQYNPFSDQEGAEMPPMPKLEVTDELTGEKQAVDLDQGQMSSENKEKIEQLLRELEADEEGEATLTTEEQEEVEVKKEELSTSLKDELHSMFSSFEDRMKSHVQDTVQNQLHDTLSTLETELQVEVDEAVKEDTTALKAHDDIIANALQELSDLEADDDYTQMEAVVAQEVQSIDDQIKAIPPSMYFRLLNGQILKSPDDLASALADMDEQTFSHHVTDNHNDFAAWLEALNDPRGQDLRDKSREEMIVVCTK